MDIQGVNEILAEGGKIVISVVTAVLGWLIVQQVKANAQAMSEIKMMIRKIELDGTDRAKEFSVSLSTINANFEAKHTNLLRLMIEEQKEMEVRWAQSLKVLTDRNEGFSARISELSEAQAILERNMYRDFMPTVDIRSIVGEVKQNIKEFVISVERKIDGIHEKIDDLKH